MAAQRLTSAAWNQDCSRSEHGRHDAWPGRRHHYSGSTFFLFSDLLKPTGTGVAEGANGKASSKSQATKKVEFARKTVVPITQLNLSSKPSTSGVVKKRVASEAATDDLSEIEEEEPILDDSDRDADWEKTDDAKKQQKKQHLRKVGLIRWFKVK